MTNDPTFTEAAFWDGSKLYLNIAEDEGIQGRRWRANEVVENYPHQLQSDGVLFQDSLQVKLLSDRVGCTCADMRNRRLPCKHVFAAAHLLGDKEAIWTSPPKPAEPVRGDLGMNVPTNLKPKKVQPQDIKVGKYFVLSDFLFSDTASREGIPNWVDWESDYGNK